MIGIFGWNWGTLDHLPWQWTLTVPIISKSTCKGWCIFWVKYCKKRRLIFFVKFTCFTPNPWTHSLRLVSEFFSHLKLENKYRWAFILNPELFSNLRFWNIKLVFKNYFLKLENNSRFTRYFGLKKAPQRYISNRSQILDNFYWLINAQECFPFNTLKHHKKCVISFFSSKKYLLLEQKKKCMIQALSAIFQKDI